MNTRSDQPLYFNRALIIAASLGKRVLGRSWRNTDRYLSLYVNTVSILYSSRKRRPGRRSSHERADKSRSWLLEKKAEPTPEEHQSDIAAIMIKSRDPSILFYLWRKSRDSSRKVNANLVFRMLVDGNIAYESNIAYIAKYCVIVKIWLFPLKPAVRVNSWCEAILRGTLQGYRYADAWSCYKNRKYAVFQEIHMHINHMQ